MKQIKTCIWDLDGTLLDTLQDLSDGVNHALEKYSLPTKTLEQIRSYVGNGAKRLIALCLPNGEEDKDFERVFTEFQSFYRENCRIKTKPYDGICQLLKKLKDLGYKQCIVSNKPDAATKKLAEDYFSGLVDDALGEKPPIPRKPAKDMVELALKKLDADKETAVYIGDSEVDVLTAKNADLPCISVSWGFRSKKELLENGAKTVCDTIPELEEVLLNGLN